MTRGRVAVIILAAALGLGFVPFSEHGASCGSAWVASNEARLTDLLDALAGHQPSAQAACDHLRGWYRVSLWLVVPGSLGVLVSDRRRRRREASLAS